MKKRLVFWTPVAIAVGLVIAMFALPPKWERRPVKADLQDANPAMRAWALRRLGDEQLYIEALHDEDPDVRCLAAERVRLPKALIPLLVDDHAQVRRQAAFSLAAIGPRGAWPALEEASQDQNRHLRAAVARALPDVYWANGDWEPKSMISMLDKLSSDEDLEVRSNAENAMERFRR